MPLVTIHSNPKYNFHHCPPLLIRVSGNPVNVPYIGAVYMISARQAKRIKKHYCGIQDCRCSEGGVVVELDPYGTQYGLLAYYVEPYEDLLNDLTYGANDF